MPLGIPGDLVIFGIVLSSLALAWYTATWRTRLGRFYAIACVLNALVVGIRLLWQAVTGSWPGL